MALIDELHPDLGDDLTEITQDHIDDAMARALALRRRSMRDPMTASAIILDDHEARRLTRQFRDRTRWTRRLKAQDGPAMAGWCWVGWVVVDSERWDHPGPLGDTNYHHTWEVWWHPATDRVWLLQQRMGHKPDDPFP